MATLADWLGFAHVPPAHLQLRRTGRGLHPGLVLHRALDPGHPGFHQRCYAAKDVRVGENGILAAVALLGRVRLPDDQHRPLRSRRTAGPCREQQGLAFPLLADRFLPAGAKASFTLRCWRPSCLQWCPTIPGGDDDGPRLLVAAHGDGKPPNYRAIHNGDCLLQRWPDGE